MGSNVVHKSLTSFQAGLNALRLTQCKHLKTLTFTPLPNDGLWEFELPQLLNWFMTVDLPGSVLELRFHVTTGPLNLYDLQSSTDIQTLWAQLDTRTASTPAQVHFSFQAVDLAERVIPTQAEVDMLRHFLEAALPRVTKQGRLAVMSK